MIVHIFLHLMTFDFILLALKMIFYLGNMQTLKKGMSRVLTVSLKHLQQNTLKKGFYEYQHTFELGDLLPHFIGLNKDSSLGQHPNTERGHAPCAYFVKHLQQNALK